MAARLTFLTGSRAGTALDLQERDLTIGRDPKSDVLFSPNEVLVSARHATLAFRAGSFVLQDQGSRNGTFVNGERINEERILEHGDLVQFGAGGPGCRYIEGAGPIPMPTLDPNELARASELFEATRASSEKKRAPAAREVSTTRDMLAVAVKGSATTRRALLVVSAVAAIAIAAAFIWQQMGRAELEQALAELSESLATERNSRSALQADIAAFQIRADSLQALLAEEQRRVANDPRMDAEAIRDMSRGVALLVFTYGYAEVDGDRLLRYDVDERGVMRFEPGPGGQPTPTLSFGGSGDPVQHQGTATGFLIDSAGVLLTNRHVAEPWARDDYLAFLRSRGQNVEGRFIDLRAYFPPGGQSYPLAVERVSRLADVAVARIVGTAPRLTVLPLASAVATDGPGDQFVLIAYPTGLRNLLYREDRDQRERILQAVGTDDVRLMAAELASRRLIQPLITYGGISDTTSREVIHTAATTVGASGGPLIDARRGVFAIHYASVRFSASDPFRTQRGVPIRYAWDILPLDVRRRLEGRN